MADNDFGYTAWGRDWVRLAQPLRQTTPNPALPRARTLARDEGVQVTIDGRVVRGVVRRAHTTSVARVEVAPMSPEMIAGISNHVPRDRSILTDDVHRAIAADGHVPAPTIASVDCTCSDDTGRCVHVLAVYYDMARRIDDDPRLALDVQQFVRGSSGNPDEAAAVPQRWTALDTLDPADYFTVR